MKISAGSESAPIVVIAGGEGFVGGSIACALVERGVNVMTIDNGLFAPARSIQAVCHRNILTRRQADATSAEELTRILQAAQVSAIVNCVGPARPSYYRKHPTETAAILIGSTMALLRIAVERQAIFVHASSSETYGDAGRTLVETNPGKVHTLSDRAAYAARLRNSCLAA
jgi:dTDP-glucose 4,6-dehydratase